MAEQVPFKHVVGGSNPSGLTRRLASLRVSIVPNKVKVVHTNPSGLTILEIEAAAGGKKHYLELLIFRYD